MKLPLTSASVSPAFRLKSRSPRSSRIDRRGEQARVCFASGFFFNAMSVSGSLRDAVLLGCR
jgi:hypothetical protein